MRPPILPDSVRFWTYLVAFVAWAVVMSAQAYYGALEHPAPDLVVGAGGVVEWLVGAGLLVATTHTTRTPARHSDLDGDGHAG